LNIRRGAPTQQVAPEDSAQSNSQVQNPDRQGGMFLSGGWRLNPNIALEIDGLFSHQEFDTPAYVGGSRRSDLNTKAPMCNAHAALQASDFRFRAAIEAGVDVLLYTSERASGAGYDELVAAKEPQMKAAYGL
jgi:hypothetical protein